MAFNLASLQRIETYKPPRILVYGIEGIGKSTFGADAPDPVFLPTEDGVPPGTVSFPLAKTYDEVKSALLSLTAEPHDFKTLVVDSVDWLEPLIWAHTCKLHGWQNLEAPGYGKGYAAALDVWRGYVDLLNGLRDDRGMTIIQIAHSEVKRFDAPDTEPYDRYGIKLHKAASGLLQEHSDAVLFANQRVSTTKSDVGFGQKKTRAVGAGERILYTEARPAFSAKNRYQMPESLNFSWADAAPYLPPFPKAPKPAA